MKKVYILILVSLIIPNLFAENIELPEITTVIEGDSIKAENDSLPDFIDVLEKTQGSGTIVPQLPDITLVEDKKEDVVEIKKNEDEYNIKNPVYSEILLSGGYPSVFHGECSVFGADNVSPYKIYFNFDSANGYNGKPMADNFSDRLINITFEKKYKRENVKWGIFTEYKSVSNGLQKQSVAMSSINKDSINGTAFFDYDLSDNIALGTNLSLDLYNRYGSLTDISEKLGTTPDFSNWQKGNYVFSLYQNLFGKWSDYGFDTELSLEYLGAFNSVKNIQGGNNHRGKVAGSVQWKNNFLKAYGGFAVNFGNKINNDSKFSAIVPFKLGIDFSLPVYFSNRNVSISTFGGLESYYNSIDRLEEKYNFSALSRVPSESAFWFCRLNVNVPIKFTFSANASIEYKHTAFNKGVWEPYYNDGSENSLHDGVYEILPRNQQLLGTDLNITYHYKTFSLKAGLNSNWFDVPALEAIQSVKIDLGFQDEKAKWGINLFGQYDVEEKWSLPIINLDCFVQISPTIRITAAVNDIIPLFNKQPRTYAGKYTDRGFSSYLLLNFVL